MRTSDFDYELPPGLIAQVAVEPRDSSRLMVVHRDTGRFEHRVYRDVVEYLHRGDLVVCNDSRVIPARLKGHKVGGEAQIELLLLRRIEPGVWEALARPGRRLRAGTVVAVGHDSAVEATVRARKDGGIFVVELSGEEVLRDVGEVPLPPYIHECVEDPERYQTVYSRVEGSVAAPTAGLHFTAGLIDSLRDKGVESGFLTLHLALDSFRPVTEDDPRDHDIHKEYGRLAPELADKINLAKSEGRRVVCVGTSTVRLVEGAVRAGGGAVAPFEDWVDLFILPGHDFKVVDAMITNFHLPRSTLLMLVSAFAGRDLILKAYREAMDRGYRFYSFGDAMLVL